MPRPLISLPMTFAARFCAHHDMPESEFVTEILCRAMNAPARWFVPMILRLRPAWLDTDYEFARYCGCLIHTRDIERELRRFRSDPCNQTFWRNVLRQRLSTRRLRIVVNAFSNASAEPPAAIKTASPFEAPEPLSGPARRKSIRLA